MSSAIGKPIICELWILSSIVSCVISSTDGYTLLIVVSICTLSIYTYLPSGKPSVQISMYISLSDVTVHLAPFGNTHL